MTSSPAALPVSAVHADSRHLTASAAVFDTRHRLVLLVDHLLSGHRQFPGGHVDPGEDPSECAIREVREETGVECTLWTSTPVTVTNGNVHPAPLVVIEFDAPADPDWGEPAHKHIDLLYIGLADSTRPLTIQPDEVAGAVWLPVDGITRRRVRADVPPVVAAAWTALTGQQPG